MPDAPATPEEPFAPVPPIVPVSPFGRPDAATRAAALRLADRIGFFLLCPRAACRRGRGCRDPDREQIPFCVWQHRGTFRFVLAALAATSRGNPAAAEPDPAPPRSPVVAETLYGRLRAAGIDIGRLRRRLTDGADEWAWERVPEATALVAARAGRAALGTGTGGRA